jgi:hypothetical protein
VDEQLTLAMSKIKGWDYQQNGADWPDIFPDCGSDHQSPINFEDPTTKYGSSYDIFSIAADQLKKQYQDLLSRDVLSLQNKNGVHIDFDQLGGYQGFTSHIGSALFDAPTEWLANNIQFHSKSEHTVNHVHYDLEL